MALTEYIRYDGLIWTTSSRRIDGLTVSSSGIGIGWCQPLGVNRDCVSGTNRFAKSRVYTPAQSAECGGPRHEHTQSVVYSYAILPSKALFELTDWLNSHIV